MKVIEIMEFLRHRDSIEYSRRKKIIYLDYLQLFVGNVQQGSGTNDPKTKNLFAKKKKK